VCPVAARRAAQAAVKAMEKLSKDSILFQEQPHFITIDFKDLMIGKKLGEGGFSVVKTVVLKSGEEQGQTFAIKYLKRKVMAQKRLFELGAADLATESMFLATLHHPHIIAYHGISNGSIESSIASGKECGFFIVIDFLHDTLEHKIVKWAEDANTHSGGLLYRMSHDYKHHRKVALQERLSVAWQIADVMEYLHSRNIIYRDLKPDNMGFDNQGNLKLFDFGLAKELKPNKANSLGKYKLTGNTGSRRYMAPEVAKNLPYDQTVDIYSFGILLWEMCAMEKPFYGFSANQHMQQVVLGGGRPKLDTSHTQWWPVKLHWVLRKCWSEDSSQRPSFTVIKETLQDLIECKGIRFD
jgi:serine/threonine protein kinase